jgi:hypothetical protein
MWRHSEKEAEIAFEFLLHRWVICFAWSVYKTVHKT